MTDTLKIIFSLITALGVFAGILAWWIGKMLSDKKDSITNTLEIEFLKKEFTRLEAELRDYKKSFEHYKDVQNT